MKMFSECIDECADCIMYYYGGCFVVEVDEKICGSICFECGFVKVDKRSAINLLRSEIVGEEQKGRFRERFSNIIGDDFE